MGSWTFFLMLGVTGIWVGLISAVAYLAAHVAADR